MCKEQGPPKLHILIYVYICNYIYIYKTFLTQNTGAGPSQAGGCGPLSCLGQKLVKKSKQ